MRIIPVIDLKQGVAVRGIGGQRELYRPVISQLTDSHDPILIARAFRDKLDLTEVYLADLDAIAGAPPALAMYRALHDFGFHLWVDAGVREPSDAAPLAEAGIDTLVAGLETLSGPEALAQLLERHSDHVAFSLDLRNGSILGDASAWHTDDPAAIAKRAIQLGVRTIIVLDVGRVGCGEGTGTESLCRRLADEHPNRFLVSGGGIRDRTDLVQAKSIGMRAVLVASALHDGRLSPADWRDL